jgi:hypothetical protein
MVHHDDVDHHDHEAIVELARLAEPIEANELVAELEAKGIKATISTDDSSGMRPNLGFAQGCGVLVFENDLQAAQQVLRDLGLD